MKKAYQLSGQFVYLHYHLRFCILKLFFLHQYWQDRYHHSHLGMDLLIMKKKIYIHTYIYFSKIYYLAQGKQTSYSSVTSRSAGPNKRAHFQPTCYVKKFSLCLFIQSCLLSNFTKLTTFDHSYGHFLPARLYFFQKMSACLPIPVCLSITLDSGINIGLRLLFFEKF